MDTHTEIISPNFVLKFTNKISSTMHFLFERLKKTVFLSVIIKNSFSDNFNLKRCYNHLKCYHGLSG